MKNYLYILGFLLLSISCQKNEENTSSVTPNVTPSIPEFAYAGGKHTIFDATSNAFSTPSPALSSSSLEKHLEGDLDFDQNFVTRPADNNPGLGPIFNNTACVSCHVRNGRATPSLSGDDISGFLIRMSIAGTTAQGGATPVPFYGNQLQNRAIEGKEKEGSFMTTETDETVTFDDGTTVTLKKPAYQITEPYRPLPSGLMLSPRSTPSVIGMGLLEAIPESDIMKLADVDDADKDGISGKPNSVWNVKENKRTLGRFGWKAGNPTVLQQTADAYHQDMGITSSLFPDESCEGQPNCDGNTEKDITDRILEMTAFYCETLAVPAVRNYDKENVIAGRQLFEKIGCVKCHVPKHLTRGDAAIAELSKQTIFPYTDLLLHDMGEGLADNRPNFEADGQEWRTAPLWGVGLLRVVNGHSRLLHDGRARNIEEAILWHGGEAKNAQEEYRKLPKQDRTNLLDFVNAL